MKQTIHLLIHSESFEFRVLTHRKEYVDVIRFTCSEEGWGISAKIHDGQADIKLGQYL